MVYYGNCGYGGISIVLCSSRHGLREPARSDAEPEHNAGCPLSDA